jgi:hypothetical protein
VSRAAPIRVVLTEVTMRDVAATIPRRCPNCKRKFDAVNSLMEQQWTPQKQYAQIEGGEVSTDGDYETLEGCVATAYWCGNCEHVLATTEEKPAINGDVLTEARRLAMANKLDDKAVARLTDVTLVLWKALADIREQLWPGGDADHQWSPDTIALVADVMNRAGMGARS